MSGETVDWLGETFRVSDKVGIYPVMRLARVARGATHGMDEQEATMEALAAQLDLLEQCIHPDDLGKLERHSNARHADMEDFEELTGMVMVALSGRPTGRPSDSSDGPQTTPDSSNVDSIPSTPSTPPSAADRWVAEFESRQRPDLALLVRRRQDALSN